MTHISDEAEAKEPGWRLAINYGPDGEENWANVYDEGGALVGNLRAHHARQIVAAFNTIAKLQHDNDMLTRGGIIEVAVRNPSVADYMKHWEGRAETAEAALARTPSREAVLEEAAKVAERDVDWTMFARQPKKDWKTGEETNVFAPMDDPDNTIPTPVNVFAYANGIAAGRAIAAAIRSLSKGTYILDSLARFC